MANMDARYTIDPELRARALRAIRDAGDLIEMNFALGDLGVEVSELIRLECQRERTADMESELARFKAREDFLDLDPETQDALVAEAMAKLARDLPYGVSLEEQETA